MGKAISKFVLVGFFVLASFGGASASLFQGQTVNVQYYWPNLSSPINDSEWGNYVVGPGVEVNHYGLFGDGNIDISDTSIFLFHTNGASYTPAVFNGFVITDVYGTIPDFTSINASSYHFSNMDPSRVTFDKDHIWVNLQGTSYSYLSTLTIGVSAVPIPAAVWLLGSGLIGLIGIRKKILN